MAFEVNGRKRIHSAMQQLFRTPVLIAVVSQESNWSRKAPYLLEQPRENTAWLYLPLHIQSYNFSMGMQSLNFWQIADENLHSNTDHTTGAAVCKSQPGQRLLHKNPCRGILHSLWVRHGVDPLLHPLRPHSLNSPCGASEQNACRWPSGQWPLPLTGSTPQRGRSWLSSEGRASTWHTWTERRRTEKMWWALWSRYRGRQDESEYWNFT